MKTQYRIIIVVCSLFVAFLVVGVMVATGMVPIREKGTCNQPKWLTTIQKHLERRKLQQIAFTTSYLDYPGEIFIINEDGSGLRNLTNHPAYDHYPVWSPDGQRLLFDSHRNGNPDIFVMDANGENVQQLTFSEREDFDPEWSPDGCQIVYTSTRRFEDGYWEAEIYLMNADGSNVRNLTNDQERDDGAASWLAGGKEIIYSSYPLSSEIDSRDFMWVMDLEGKILKSFEENGQWISVSPDGKRVLYTGDERKVTVLDVGTLEKTVIDGGSHPVWHPDGNKVAFEEILRVIEFDLVSGETSELLPESIYEIKYSPDGRYLAYIDIDDKDYELFLFNLETEEVTQLTHDEISQRDIAWRP